MTLEEFLLSKNIDLSTVVCFHFIKTDDPEMDDDEILDFEALMNEWKTTNLDEAILLLERVLYGNNNIGFGIENDIRKFIKKEL